MIRAVVFDWGGVIQRTESRAPRQRLEAALGLAPGGVERAVFQSEAWELASTGRCSGDEAWARIVASLGYPGDILAFVEAFFAGDRVDPTMLDLIASLRRLGYKVGLLSNAPSPRQADDSPVGRWGMEGAFDARVFSYAVGALKPDPRMYRAILHELGVAPDNVLFIDDAPANVEGARALGIKACLFSEMSALYRCLERYGLPACVLPV